MNRLLPIVFVAAILAALFFVWYGSRTTPPRYSAFISRDKPYFEALAGVCDQVLSNRAGSWILAGDDASLPKPIRDLHPTEVECMRHSSGNNEDACLFIRIGVSRAGYVIGWGLNDYGDGNQQWQLAVGGDGEPKILFSKKVSLYAPTNAVDVP